ncbi:MAG TPA: redoxin domain-containing protein [Tepidisphaeraceae bacterium]|jgi:peroxiredoxin|nr:redoxin domain-containing protein [Tepidisphaeraceae bacterium]
MVCRRFVFLVLGLLLCTTAFARAANSKSSSSSSKAGDFGSSAADFPPGAFTDNGHYSLDEFKGKVVVLYFGCPVCPTNRASVAGRNKVVEEFRDKPVRFLAITPAAMSEARDYATATKLEMPCFADGMGVMQHRYGTNISLKNIWQVRVIGPDGQVIGYEMTSAAIEKAVANVKWKYKDDGYDPKLAGIVNALEWNQFVPAMTALKPLLKQKNKTGDSARALYEKVKSTEGTQWAADADAAASDDKVKAVELYSRLAACFPDDALGKHAADATKKLKSDKAVTSELAARQRYAQLAGVMSKATPNQKPAVVNYCTSISQQYPDTPTGKAAGKLAEELQASSVAE